MALEPLLSRFPRDAASIALSFLRALDLDGCSLVSPWTVAEHLGIYVTHAAQRACRGRWLWRWWSVWISARESELQRACDLMHELAHLACDFCGVSAPHSELLVNDVAEHIWLTDRGARRVAALADWDVPRMVQSVGEQVPALTVLRRVAETEGAIVIARQRGLRFAFAPRHFVVPPRPRLWELRWLHRFLADGTERPVLWGVRLQRYLDPLANEPGIAIVVPPDACELVAARPWLLD